MKPLYKAVATGMLSLLLLGCATTTTVTTTPSPQDPICQTTGMRLNADALLGTNWRPDQKDVKDREAFAIQGMNQFVERSGCFVRTELQILASTSASAIQPAYPQQQKLNPMLSSW
jgi:hypothetical protein